MTGDSKGSWGVVSEVQANGRSETVLVELGEMSRIDEDEAPGEKKAGNEAQEVVGVNKYGADGDVGEEAHEVAGRSPAGHRNCGQYSFVGFGWQRRGRIHGLLKANIVTRSLQGVKAVNWVVEGGSQLGLWRREVVLDPFRSEIGPCWVGERCPMSL